MGFPRRVLVAVDFTEVSDHALDAAVRLARTTQASLCVMAALDPHGTETERGASQHLARIAQRLGDAQLKVDTHIEAGDPREAIITAATNAGADLIVMGTHVRSSMPPPSGRGPAGGSVAEAVMRNAHVPVMIVRGAIPRS